MKRLIVNRTQCTGCESCVLSCAFEHNDAFVLGQSRIQIDRSQEQASFTPQVCIQCDGRFCITACPIGALSVDDELGCVRVDESACTRCRACQAACPVSGIHFGKSDSFPLICDLCGGNPTCADTCRKPLAVRYAEGGEIGGR